jgi:hypothetical protein
MKQENFDKIELHMFIVFATRFAMSEYHKNPDIGAKNVSILIHCLVKKWDFLTRGTQEVLLSDIYNKICCHEQVVEMKTSNGENVENINSEYLGDYWIADGWKRFHKYALEKYKNKTGL